MSVATGTNEVRRAETDAVASEMVMELLTDAYLMEIETVMNYLAAATNLDGLQGRQVALALAADIDEELGHARRLAERINQLGGVVPGSGQFPPGQRSLQPPPDSGDVEAVIAGVLDAERAAIATYDLLARAADGIDYVTHDLAVDALADEEGHRRLFEGFLREYRASGS